MTVKEKVCVKAATNASLTYLSPVNTKLDKKYIRSCSRATEKTLK